MPERRKKRTSVQVAAAALAVTMSSGTIAQQPEGEPEARRSGSDAAKACATALPAWPGKNSGSLPYRVDREKAFCSAGLSGLLLDRGADEWERDKLYVDGLGRNAAEIVARQPWLSLQQAKALMEAAARIERARRVPAAGGPDRVLSICVADGATGKVERVLTTEDSEGALQRIGKPAEPVLLDRGLDARRAGWYRAGEPISWNGKVYRQGGEWRETALNRYLRSQGLYRGVPLLSIWPGGDRSLAVLVDQETCTFGSYEPEE